MEFINNPLFSDSSLVAYYQLEGTADSKGTYNLTNNNSVTFSPAKFNNGADFGTANSNKYLSNSSNMGITGGSITLAGWVKLTTEISSGYYTFLEQNDTTTKTTNLIRYNYNSGTPQLQFQRGKIDVGDEGPTYTVTLGTTNINHVAMTYDGTTVYGYFNGVSIGSASASGTGTGSRNSGFMIGADNPAGAAQFSNALIDDAVVFNSALNSSQVHNIFTDSGIIISEI